MVTSRGRPPPAMAVSGQMGKQPPNSSKSRATLQPWPWGAGVGDPGGPGSWGDTTSPVQAGPVVWDRPSCHQQEKGWAGLLLPPKARGRHTAKGTGTPGLRGRGWPGGDLRAPASAILG